MTPDHYLSKRENWQAEANDLSQKAEVVVFSILNEYVKSRHFTGYTIEAKPKLAKNIYGQRRGIVPESAIANKANGRIALIEVKRQNDDGNAHERAGKYFFPGIRERLQQICNSGGRYPVFFIFTNGIARSPRYHSELKTWFDAPNIDPLIQHHLLIWENRKIELLLEFFDEKIKCYLDEKSHEPPAVSI